MSYKDLVHQIASLSWEQAAPEDIILLSLATAREFAASLRAGLALYPSDERLLEMAADELATGNMHFEDYEQFGDHWEFLDFFVKKYHIEAHSPALSSAINAYLQGVDSLSPQDRAMTIFSREEELTSIFERVQAAHDWEQLGYGFYKYYLAQHILFDSGDEGHAYLTKHFPLSESVLVSFYQLRLDLYQSLWKA